MKGRAPQLYPSLYEQHIHIDNDLAMKQDIIYFKLLSIEKLPKISTKFFSQLHTPPPRYLKNL